MKKLLFLLTCVLSSASWAQVHFIESSTIRTEKVSQNTPASDFAPTFVGKELYYSAFDEAKIKQLSQGKSKDLFYNLFTSPVDKYGNLQDGKKIILTEISAGYHAGPVSYCDETNELFVTLSNYENAEIKNVVFQKKNIPLKIIILKRSGNDWSYAGEVPFNSSSYSVGHPSISTSGDTLIFSSDIQGKGMGGTDLYMSVRKNGKWSEMINLGNKINSSADDMFPYLHKGKILFYASNGKEGGKGKFDIWYSVLSDKGFEDPVNLKELNSPADDFGLVIHSNEEIGYFVSNQNSSNGDDDIYKVIFAGEYDLELLVKDKKSMAPIPGVKVEFNDKQTLYTNSNGSIQRGLEKSSDYTAKTNLDGYMNESVSFSTKNHPYGTLKKELFVEKAEVGQKFVMNNIYYLFDKWNILPESEQELDKLVKILNDNPSWKVELGSHTDCRGTHTYNDILSQKRSDSAVNYITGKGIMNNRIIAKGYGENQLINHCKDGISCTEDQHQLNRRTEFKILEME